MVFDVETNGLSLTLPHDAGRIKDQEYDALTKSGLATEL